MTAGINVLKLTIHQYKKLYGFTAGYLLVLVFFALFVEQPVSGLVTGLLSVPFAAVFLNTLVSFVNPDADLVASGSHYPPLLLRLPVRTRTLALWPMVAGTVWAAIAWLVFAGLFLARRDVPMGVAVPMVGFMSIVLCMQAIMWTPFRFGVLRLLLILLVPLTLVLTGIWLQPGHSALSLVEFYACVGVAGGALAWRGVNLARTTVTYGGPLWQRTEPVLEERDRTPAKPFKSALSAQVWMEWRAQGRLLPIFTVAILSLASIPLFFDRVLLSPTPYGDFHPWVATMFPYLPFIPLMISTVVGMGARKPNLRSGEGAYHLFYATRPLHSVEVVRAKVYAFTIGTLLSAGITLVFMFGWLMMPAATDGTTSNGLAVATTYLGWLSGTARLALLSFAFLTVAMTWRNQYVGAFVDYVPRRWIALGYPLAVLLVGGYMFGFFWSSIRPFYSETASSPVTFTLGIWILVKLIAASWAGYRLRQLSANGRRQVTRQILGWVVCVAGLTGLLTWYVNLWKVDNAWRSEQPLWFTALPLPILVAMAIVPLGRPIIAHYCLQVGRHQ